MRGIKCDFVTVQCDRTGNLNNRDFLLKFGSQLHGIEILNAKNKSTEHCYELCRCATLLEVSFKRCEVCIPTTRNWFQILSLIFDSCKFKESDTLNRILKLCISLKSLTIRSCSHDMMPQPIEFGDYWLNLTTPTTFEVLIGEVKLKHLTIENCDFSFYVFFRTLILHTRS